MYIIFWKYFVFRISLESRWCIYLPPNKPNMMTKLISNNLFFNTNRVCSLEKDWTQIFSMSFANKTTQIKRRLFIFIFGGWGGGPVLDMYYLCNTLGRFVLIVHTFWFEIKISNCNVQSFNHFGSCDGFKHTYRHLRVISGFFLDSSLMRPL